MAGLSFGIEFVPQEPILSIADYVKLAEEKGFKYAWITDHYNNRDVWSTLSVLALRTEKIKLGSGVTNPYTRNVAQIASSIVTVDELSNGRAVLGIGPGDKATFEALGIQWVKPVKTIVEAVTVIRRLIAGERVKFEGEVVKVGGAKLAVKPKATIPIYIGAQGPVMLRTAGQIGDGVLINASHPKDFELAISQVKAGVEKACRKMEDVDVAAYTSFSIDQDPQKAEKAARIVVAFIVAGAPGEILERHGISLESAKTVREAIGKGDFKTATKSITSEMLSAFAVCGTPETCVSRIEELLKTGVTQIIAGSPLGPDKKTSIDLIGEKIIPSFQKP